MFIGRCWGTDCHASDIGHWLAMTYGTKSLRDDVGIVPYE